MKQCQVSFSDADEIEHAGEVDARTLYEAVGLAIDRFRRVEHVKYEPKGLHEFSAARSWYSTPADQEDVRRLAPPACRIAPGYGAQNQIEGDPG